MSKYINIPQCYIARTIIGSVESIYLSSLDKIKAYKFDDIVQNSLPRPKNSVVVLCFFASLYLVSGLLDALGYKFSSS